VPDQGRVAEHAAGRPVPGVEGLSELMSGWLILIVSQQRQCQCRITSDHRLE